MDAIRIRRRYGPRLALWGTVGRQTTFAFADVAEIRREVRERIETLGPAGLVLCPAYDIDEPDVPWANVAAFLAAGREWRAGRRLKPRWARAGRYPTGALALVLDGSTMEASRLPPGISRRVTWARTLPGGGSP